MKIIRRTFPAFIMAFIMALSSCHSVPSGFTESAETVSIYPDYSSLIIPPNIAPMNFRILNEGLDFRVEMKSGTNMIWSSSFSDGRVIIPQASWKKLLEKGRGGKLQITVLRKTVEGNWEKLKSIENEISADAIEPYIAFRKLPASYILWDEMGIYQRSLESFEERPIMANVLTDKNCMNCHAFNSRDPEQFMFHMRAVHGGTFIKTRDGEDFVDTKSDHTRSAGVYPSWHPSGELIAFSVNQINQVFHSRIGKLTYVMDKFSDIVLYDVKENTVTRPAELASASLENMPSWSVDGKKLFYINAASSVDKVPYDSVFYDLMSVDFDMETRKFGRIDTLIRSGETGKSISFPRESPRGGLLAFVGVDYGYFAIYNNEADIYFYDLASESIRIPEINSGFTESYPSWSGNGNWLMFISKRDDGILSQVWFCHVDEEGNTGKAFVLPQENPDFYKDYLFNYNRPEFISGKVGLNPRKILSFIKNGTKSSGFNEKESVSIATGATIPTTKENTSFYNHD